MYNFVIPSCQVYLPPQRQFQFPEDYQNLQSYLFSHLHQFFKLQKVGVIRQVCERNEIYPMFYFIIFLQSLSFSSFQFPSFLLVMLLSSLGPLLVCLSLWQPSIVFIVIDVIEATMIKIEEIHLVQMIDQIIYAIQMLIKENDTIHTRKRNILIDNSFNFNLNFQLYLDLNIQQSIQSKSMFLSLLWYLCASSVSALQTLLSKGPFKKYVSGLGGRGSSKIVTNSDKGRGGQVKH